MASNGICAVDGCGKPIRSRGWCKSHYERWRAHGSPTAGRAAPRTGCDVPGCDKPHEARGYCSAHYDKLKKYGDPLHSLVSTAPGEPLSFLQSLVGHDGDGCVLWPFARYPSGYGEINDGGTPKNAHRIMCVLAHGEPPTPDHVAAHSCGNGFAGCVNPRHLRWATQSENENDKVLHGTSNRGERSGSAKLTESDVRAIRSLEGRMTQQEIADKFGVHLMTVNSILRRRNWGWLE